jgi:methylated-DNA-[protein]-cysteine S-methyltransferase
MSSATYYGYCRSELGLIEVGGTESEIVSVEFVERHRPEPASNAVVREGVRQIDEYMRGERRVFDLPLGLYGTDFQRRVWQQLLTVPYGQTATYQEIADAIGNPLAVRAVGAANGRNPISLVVPCHRIIGHDGHLVGYGGGLWRKEWLLRHEGALLL